MGSTSRAFAKTGNPQGREPLYAEVLDIRAELPQGIDQRGARTLQHAFAAGKGLCAGLRAQVGRKKPKRRARRPHVECSTVGDSPEQIDHRLRVLRGGDVVERDAICGRESLDDERAVGEGL